MNKTRTIKVDYLARVEGEGALYVTMKDQTVTDLKFKIFEPPRFFEAFMQGRRYDEAPDITARICGICPVAYQMSSAHAMEYALGVQITPEIRELRRLLYCGEWIESHVLHVYMLHAPDFLGYEDSIQMAKDHPDAVKTALRLKKIGNEIVTTLGGREIHPINVRIGGFYRVPDRHEFDGLLENLKWARDAAREMVRFTATLEFPDFEQDYEFVSVSHPNEYPFNEGHVVSNRGLDIPVSQYEEHFMEEHVEHSNALHSVKKGGGNYHVGPLARYSLNFNRFTPSVQQAAREAGLGETCKNPFKSIIVRSVETLHAVEEAIRIIENYRKPDRPFVPAEIRAGIGYGATEAPRGMLYHRYEVDEKGDIKSAKIVPPTSQNQKTIEKDLWNFIPGRVDLSDEKLTWQLEQAIRNYDPCISCATHFLKVHVEEEKGK